MTMQTIVKMVHRSLGMRVAVAAIGAAALAACSAASTETRLVEDSFTVAAPARMEVSIDNGSIEITSEGSNGNTIQVTARVRNPDRVTYDTSQEGGTVRVRAQSREGFGFFGGGSTGVDLVVSVPPEISLELESSNGRIEVNRVDGPISAKTSNGRVTITESTGDIEVGTSNGRVELSGVQGQVEVQTSNGAISYQGTLRPGSENKLQTSNGGIEVSLADTPGVEIDASTSNERVSSSLPVAIEGTIEGTTSGNQLRGTIGGGGSKLELRTSNGSISIR